MSYSRLLTVGIYACSALLLVTMVNIYLLHQKYLADVSNGIQEMKNLFSSLEMALISSYT